MEKLMKPAEYAQELGISRQAVYAKIKRGILTAKNVEGKLYIVIDKTKKEEATHHPKETTVKSKTSSSSIVSGSGQQNDVEHYKILLEAKDETISVLKGTVKDLKKSNKQISTTLKGEIDLIKEAFHEMRALYIHQLEYQKPVKEEAIEISSEEDTVELEEEHWISVKKFFKQYKITKEKQQAKIEKRLKKVYKSGDERVMKVEDKLKMNANRTYEDIVK
jgi:hypothetical protein